ncbi:MAG: hypothetical protein ACC682_16870 [Gemmatimonadota bacterium]
MFEDSTRAFQRAVRAVFAASLVLSLFSVFAVSDVEAQGRRIGHVLFHDSSNPPPGHAKGKGKGHQKTPKFSIVSAAGVIMTPAVQAATSGAVMGVRGMLNGRSLMRENGLSLSPEVQGDLSGLLDGDGDGAILRLMTSLRGPENDVAGAEAANLVTLLARLADEPEMFPAVALAYNAFVDASSDAFVLDPPEELLAMRAVLFTVLEPTLRAADDWVADDDDDEDLDQSQLEF